MTLPSWLQDLRRLKIVNVVQSKPSAREGYLLGRSWDEIRQDVIGGGQADFDEPFGDLSGADRVLLYAYVNQIRHLEELVEAFTQLFQSAVPREPLIVLDLGSGPFTGGLAFAAVVGNKVPFSYIGLDRSSEMRNLGETLAAEAERVGALNCMDRQWVGDLESVAWTDVPRWRPVLAIASYLLASPTLDVSILVEEVNKLCARFGRGSVTVLYTNSSIDGAKRNFGAFRTALESVGFSMFADERGSVTIERLSELKVHTLRYALFHRDRQETLDV